MQQIKIDATDFMSGVQFEDNMEGKGLSPVYKGQNLYRKGGAVLYPQVLATTIAIAGSTLTNKIVATCNDPSYLGKETFVVDKTGQFWIIDGESMEWYKQDDTASHHYHENKSDIKFFQGYIFATCDIDIIKLPYDMATIDKSWWVTTKSMPQMNASYPHPMEIIEDSLYIADKSGIHVVDKNLNTTEDFFLLPDLYNITAIKKHTNGIYLLAFCAETANMSHTKKTNTKCFVLDPTGDVLGKVVQEIQIDDQVESVVNMGGILYVTYGDNFGYFDGSKLKLLKKLNLQANSPVYKGRITATANTVLVPELDSTTKAILAFGDVSGKGNLFFYPWAEASSNQEISAMFSSRTNTIIISYYDTAYRVKRLDFTATTNGSVSGSKTMTAKKTVATNSWARRIDIFTEPMVSGSAIGLFLMKQTGSLQQLGSVDYSTDGAVNHKRIDCNVRVNELQLALAWDGTTAVGVKQIIIYVEPE